MGFIAPDKWFLEDALVLVRELQPQTRKFDYHLALGGGVLNKGQSDKDLDLYFLPLSKTDKCNNRGLVGWLSSLWGKPKKFWVDKVELTMAQYQAAAQAYRDDHPHLDNDEYIPRNMLNPYLQTEYKDLDHSFYGFKGKYLYGGLRVDVFVMGGDKLEGAEWFEEQVEGEAAYDPEPILEPPPLGIARDDDRYVGQNRIEMLIGPDVVGQNQVAAPEHYRAIDGRAYQINAHQNQNNYVVFNGGIRVGGEAFIIPRPR